MLKCINLKKRPWKFFFQFILCLEGLKYLHSILSFRYEKYWIPLILSNSEDYETDLEFLPPIDIHWVWHVHMLAPLHYAHDLTESSLRRIINHKPEDLLGESAISKRKKTAAKWSNLFPEVPFEIDLKTIIPEENEFKSPISYDILSASARQKIFYYQVRNNL